MKALRPYLILLAIALFGALLRFWNLDAKPLWLDEVITALFSLGRSYYDVPLEQAFPLNALDQLFRLQPETTCAQIAQTITMQSVHPPLFFCWMHHWLSLVNGLPLSWVWKLRSLPALVGVGAIVALYQLNRVAFSTKAGLTGALLMAVSPYAVYLSQEARHYTLPLLLVTLALLGLYQLQVDLYRQQFRPLVWLGWVAVNSLGFYVHYFFVLAVIAQVATLVINVLSFRYLPLQSGQPYRFSPWRSLGAIALAAIGVCLTYLPWLPTLVWHLTRSETDWLAIPQQNWAKLLAPLYQLPVGWILMVIALPVEDQPIWVAVPLALVMITFTGWLLWSVRRRFGQLWSKPETHLATRLLLVFVLMVVLEFLGITYVLGKNITMVPRYNFIYFPALCALLGAMLAQPTNHESRMTQRPMPSLLLVVALVGVLSSGFVVTNLAFQKPYEPDQVARQMRFEPERSLFAVTAYKDWQDVALGLSFALALQRQQPPQTTLHTNFAFLSRSLDYPKVWEQLRSLQQPQPLNLWTISPGLRRQNHPSKLSLANNANQPQVCNIDPKHYYLVGIPYQLYRCEDRA